MNGTEKAEEEIEVLRSEVKELRETIAAITSGEVDAIVVTKGDTKRIYSLEGADYPYRILIENIREGAITLSLDGMILYCNSAFAGMTGMPLTVIPGMYFRDHVVPKDRDEFSRQVRSAQETASACDISLCSASGTIPVSVSMTPVNLDGNRKISMVVADRRKDYDRLLLQGRMLDAVADAVIAADPGRKIIYWNEAATKTYGWRPDEAIGGDFYGLTMPGLSPKDAEMAFFRLSEGRGWSGEQIAKHKDGHDFPVFMRDAPVFDDNGRFIAVIGASNDISVRKEAQEAIQKSEERFRELAEKAGSIILRFDIQGRITFFNEFAEDYFGYSRAEVFGKPAVGLIIPRKESTTGRDLEAMVQDIVANPKKFAINENENIRKNGERVWIRWTNMPVFHADGTIREFTSIGTDITDRKKAELALQREMQKLDILADSARLLLTSETPEQIVQAVCERVMLYLDCQVFFNYLIEDGRSRMRLNAYGGIPDATADGITPLDFGVAVCGCVGRDGSRIIAEDVQNTPDPRTDLVRSFGVMAYACHPLLYQGKTIGTLSFGTISRARFTEEELDLMAAVTDLVATAMARKKSELALTEALAEKEVLLSEIHHRVKNNLTAFIALLSLEGSYEETPAGQRLKKDLQNRARSMALIHDTLYRTGNFSKVDMNLYLKTLVQQIAPMYTNPLPVEIVVEADDVMLDLDRATPCGLIVNELVVNSLKYAFPNGEATQPSGRNNQIAVRMVKKDGDYSLIVSDNGIGFPSVDMRSAKTLGLRLVNFLARHQLRATIDVATSKGTELTIWFSEDPK